MDKNYKHYLHLLNLKDKETLIHSINVCKISTIIGQRLNLSYEDLITLQIGSLLHDIGKLKINNELLNKTGKLSEEEYEQVKKHTEFGFNILSQNASIGPNVIRIVYEHHERGNGDGYPNGLFDDEISILAKICSVADSFEAMKSRDYSTIKNIEQIKNELLICSSKGLYDKKIVEVLINTL